MKKAVIVMAVVLLMICLSVWALGWEHETTGHLIVSFRDKENWLSLWRLFGPKNVTYTNTTIRRSVGFYPKRNPRPMYVYAQHFNERLPTVGENIMTNGLVAVKYPTVGVDVRCGTFSVSCQDSGSGQTGDVVDFTINRYSVVTNGVKTFFGRIDFQAGCGAYKRSKMNNTSFGSTYCAETNAMLLTSIPYEYSNVGGRFVDATMLVGKDEYMVMRTRVATDDSGVVTSCNYSKIEGPMWVGGGVLFDCLVFNPRPNDPNLEPGENLARHR